MKTSIQFLRGSLPCLLWLARAGLAAEYEQNLDKSFPVAAGGKLVMQADRGSIDVTTDGRDQVQVKVFRKVKGGTKAQADDLFNNHEVTFAQEGNTVSVVAKNKKEPSGGWSFRRVNLEVHYQVSIPRRFDVELKTAGGDIRIGDLDGRASTRTTSGSINLKTVTGKVEAGDAGGDIAIGEAGGNVTAQTTSGSINLQKVKGKLEASNAGGDIRLNQAGDDVSVKTTSGSITLGVVNGNVEAGNAGGDIKIESVAGEVAAQTTSGSIRIKTVQGKDLRARNAGGNVEIGQAAGKVEAETTSGSISIQSAGGNVEAKNAGGDISIGKASAGVLAQTTSGSIRIKTVKGTLQARNSGGDIGIEDVGGDAQLRTTSGSISVGLAKGRLEAKNSGGDVKVRQALGPVIAGTSSGTLSVNFGLSPTGENRLEVAGGGIEVGLPQSAAVDLDAKSSGGKVVADMPVAVTVSGAQKAGSLQGKINGGGPALVLRASSGDIHLATFKAPAMAAEDEAPAK